MDSEVLPFFERTFFERTIYMKLSYLIKNLRIVQRNREWLTAPLPLSQKLSYYPAVAIGYVRLLVGRQKFIQYLGRPFYYDNPATPLNLQIYPYEVGVKILGEMTARPRIVLDVGGNIGQFCCTLTYFVPECQIDCIEPNHEIFGLLERNVMSNTRLYNCALGSERRKVTLYYEPNRSAVGSFLKENAGRNTRIKEIEVQVENDVARLTGRSSYDLIKIDVEGFEFHVIKTLQNVRTKYLYIEVSGGGRAKPFTDGQLYHALIQLLGDYKVLYASGWRADSSTYELLLEFL